VQEGAHGELDRMRILFVHLVAITGLLLFIEKTSRKPTGSASGSKCCMTCKPNTARMT
jgi:hypothetical protein